MEAKMGKKSKKEQNWRCLNLSVLRLRPKSILAFTKRAQTSAGGSCWTPERLCSRRRRSVEILCCARAAGTGDKDRGHLGVRAAFSGTVHLFTSFARAGLESICRQPRRADDAVRQRRLLFSQKSVEILPSIVMVMSTSHANQTMGTCFSVNQPPFHHNLTIASAYFSTTFTGLGLSSNLIALVVLLHSYQRTHSRSRSSFHIFLASLVVTDFMGLLVTGSIVVSFHITHFNWAEVDPQCHFCTFMGMSMVFYGLCPLLLGTAMAIERFVGINRPFAHSSHMSKSRAVFTVLLVWVFAGSISLLPVAGLGSYHLQMPGSWCFLNISSRPLDMMFCLIFSLVGLLSLTLSFFLNTVSVVTLLHVCCREDAVRHQRNQEVEMMVQLIWIMIIASVCWCPLLVVILQNATSAGTASPEILLVALRLACLNQICDPWIYILCQLALRRRERSARVGRSAVPGFLSRLEVVSAHSLAVPRQWTLLPRSVFTTS
ncbi:thromboxane A2 receptor-like [Arapaima gigas]